MFTKEDVQKVAKLAKLSLNSQEEDQMSSELDSILTYIEKLNELKLDGVEATSHAVEVQNVFREDKLQVCEVKEEVFEGAPDKEGHLFKVPRVI